jgi:hypothetical protein
MDDLMELYKKYSNGEYDISDVSRIISYIALPNVSEEYIRQLEYQIEHIRFMSPKEEQTERIKLLLEELIEKSS